MRSLSMVGLLFAFGCAPTAPEPARLELNRSRLEFGTVEAGVGAFRTVLALGNSGETPVHVTSVAFSPPVPELELEGLPIPELAGGERKLLTVLYRPPVDGEVSTTLRLEADDGAGPRELSVTGRALRLDARLSLDQGASCAGAPGSLDFGTVTNGTTVTRRLLVESTGTGTFSVLRARASPADAGFTLVNDARSLAPGGAGAVTIDYDPKIAGPQTGVITLETNSLALPKLEVPFCATGLVSELCVTPASLSFGGVAAGSSAESTLTATSCGNLPVVLEGASLVAAATTGPGFSLTADAGLPLTLAPRQSAAFQLRFDAVSNLRQRTEVRFTSSSLVTPEVLVPAGANLPPPCNLRLDSESLRFFKDLAPAQSVRLINQGGENCLIERMDILPVGAPFQLERRLELPAVLGAHDSVELVVKYVPGPNATKPENARLELELDWVHVVSLQGDPRPPAGCHLIPLVPFVDFGLMSAGSASRTFGLANVGTSACSIFGATSDRSELSVAVPLSVAPGQTVMAQVSYAPGPNPAPVEGTLTITSSDVDDPQRKLTVYAGQVRCDPNCQCLATQTPTYWHFEGGASAVTPTTGGLGAFYESCAPQRCAESQVAVQVGRDAFVCSAPPPTCAAGLGLDFVGDGWTCVPCALVIQYGGLFGGQRVCAPVPAQTCGAGEVQTFDAHLRRWSCKPTCNNGEYDQRLTPGGALVCVPC